MTSNRNDCKLFYLEGLFGEGNISDLFLKWLQLGATSDNISDAQLEFLKGKGVTADQINDAWYEYLGDLGYEGALADRFSAYWCALAVSGELPHNSTVRNLPLLIDRYDRSPFGIHATLDRASGTTVQDYLGNTVEILPMGFGFEGCRYVHNLATGVVTETITVNPVKSYLVCIKGDAGATAVMSGAFSATITADGTNRITFPNGTAIAATTASLTVTVTGSLTQLQVEAAD